MVASSLIAFMSLAPSWAVGNHLQLTWSGSDYVPVGIQTEANSKQIPEAIAAGIKDFNIEVPAGGAWKDIAAKMGDSRYFFTVTSSLPNALGTVVQPQYYRLNNIRSSQTISCSLPGATQALVVVALAHDGSIISYKSAPVINGFLKTDVKAAAESDQVVLIYPTGESLEMEDLWERLDERRDQILRQIRIMGAQPGLRGIINPLGSTPYLANRDNGFVPSSPTFRREFADFLEEKYRNILTLMRAWNLSAADLENFSDAAQLIPLWNGARGVKALYNPKQNTLATAEPKRSAYWSDLSETISKTRVRRVHRIIRSIRKASSLPIFQDWAGWSWFFENPENELSGLSVRLNKFSPSGLLNSVSGAMSSNLRSRNPGPVFAVDVPYSQDLDQPAVLEDLSAFGVRGLFVKPRNSEDLAKISKMTLSSGESKPNAIFFPVNASNPAFVQRLPGNLLWLPSPADGNRLDLGKDLSGYQISDGVNISYIIWATGGRTQMDFLLNNPTAATIRSLNGNPPIVTATKTGLKIELDHNPILISGASHCPIPQSELLRLEREIGTLFSVAANQRRDTTLESLDFRKYRDSLQTAPDKAYLLAKKVMRNLSGMLTGLIWSEFESSGNNTFSEVVSDAGCSNGAYLGVRTPLAEATGVVYAALNVPQRSTGNLDLWISARIPNQADKARLKVKIGGQTLAFNAPPLSPYGSGFAWYNLGTTRLPSFKTEVRVELTGTASTDVALDCVVLSPQTFQPNNVQVPEFLVVPPENQKPPEKSGS